MHYQRLIFVLPSYGLDDFPEHLEETLAIDLLGAWTLLWHPALLHGTNSIPEWKRADSGSLDVENGIVLAPQASISKVDQPLRERFSLHQNLYLESSGSRAETLKSLHQALANALSSTEITPKTPSENQSAESQEEPLPSISLERLLESDPRLLDFYALGFAYLQIHLLTKRLRYSSNLNQPLFSEQAIEASKAYLAKDDAETERWIQSCFDQLSQERDHYYSQTAYLIDLTLLATSTLGSKFAQQLAIDRPLNVLASASLLQTLDATQPNHAVLFKKSLEEGRSHLVGGVDVDRETRQMTQQELTRYLDAGHRAYEARGYPTPKVFAKYGGGLTADFPMHLLTQGFQGALLFDWEGGSYPTGNQGKITWESADGSGIDTISNYILDASSASSFLAIGSTLGAQFDHHQVPTILLAHWPCGTCEAFEDFQRVVKRTPALGVWTSVVEYFETTQRPYHQERIAPSKFPSTFAPPTESEKIQLQVAMEGESANAIDQLAIQIAHWLGKGETDLPLRPGRALVATGNDQDAKVFEAEVPKATADALSSPASEPNREVAVSLFRNEAMHRLKKALPRTSKPGTNAKAWLLANPYGGPRRVSMSLPTSLTSNPDLRIYAADGESEQSDAVIDLPPMGIVRVESRSPNSSRPSKRKGASIASSSTVLGNEFIEAHLDPATGKLAALYVAQRRGNRMSGMLAVRLKKGVSSELYTTMQVESIAVERSNSTFGRIRVNGQLLAGKKLAAKFSLAYSLWRGSRLLEVDIAVSSVDSSLLDDNGYVAWRTAWPNESSSLAVWNQGVKQPFGGKRASSPLLIEIDEVEHRAYIVPGGCSLHHRVNERFLDTVLGPATDENFKGRIGLGIDLPRPYQSASEWLDPPMWIEDDPMPLANGHASWFIQSSVPNVALVPWSSLVNADGKLIGMRAWLHESAGKGCSARIECFRTPKKAARVELSGRLLSNIELDGDSLVISVRPNEQSIVDVYWS